MNRFLEHVQSVRDAEQLAERRLTTRCREDPMERQRCECGRRIYAKWSQCSTCRRPKPKRGVAETPVVSEPLSREGELAAIEAFVLGR